MVPEGLADLRHVLEDMGKPAFSPFHPLSLQGCKLKIHILFISSGQRFEYQAPDSQTSTVLVKTREFWRKD